MSLTILTRTGRVNKLVKVSLFLLLHSSFRSKRERDRLVQIDLALISKHNMAAEDSREAQRGDEHEESSPLLQGKENDGKICSKGDAKAASLVPPPAAEEYGWTADGLPVSQGSVIGEPIRRNQWNSGLFTCLGRNDEFCSSDLEVCEYFVEFV